MSHRLLRKLRQISLALNDKHATAKLSLEREVIRDMSKEAHATCSLFL